ncbi:MAG: ribbon-helix-helix protein, CopG family [Nitrospirae bacterium]|nr:ribbon-helix-helix protein, CopG family [Nitrospirota bacterium]
MEAAITVRLPKDLVRQLSAVARKRRLPRSAIVREALQRQLALQEFEELAAETRKRAAARGIVSEEQIFDMVS